MSCIFRDCDQKVYAVRKGMVQGHPECPISLCRQHFQCEVTLCDRPLSIVKQIDTGEWVFMCLDHHLIHEKSVIETLPLEIRGPCAVVNCKNLAVAPCGPSFVCQLHHYCQAYPCKAVVPPGARVCPQHIHLAFKLFSQNHPTLYKQ